MARLGGTFKLTAAQYHAAWSDRVEQVQDKFADVLREQGAVDDDTRSMASKRSSVSKHSTASNSSRASRSAAAIKDLEDQLQKETQRRKELEDALALVRNPDV